MHFNGFINLFTNLIIFFLNVIIKIFIFDKIKKQKVIILHNKLSFLQKIRYSVFGIRYSVFGIRYAVFGIRYSVFAVKTS